VAITSDRGVIKILNASTGKELLAWNDHTTGVSSVMFSPDGKLIATASNDGAAKVWEASTGKNLLTLPVPGASFISFSPDGKRLAVGGEAGVYVFVLPIEDLVALAKSRLIRTLTTEECQQYLHVETCPAGP
jgi:WD40 repeat protein